MSHIPGHETSPYEELRQGRTAVDRLLTGMLDFGGMFREVAATQVLLATASPRIRFVEFTGDEEKENGADWLWWWVDRDGTCYGLFIEAKILKLHGKRWNIDFAYKTQGDDRTQISKLIKVANRFDVPAAYVLYCGDSKYRATLDCDRTHDGVPCKERDRVGVSTVSALMAGTAVGLDGRNSGVSAFHDAVPVEDIASPDGLDAPIVPLARVGRGPRPLPAAAAAGFSPCGKGTSPADSADQEQPVRRGGGHGARCSGHRRPFRERPQRLRAFLGAVPRAHAPRSAGGGPRLRTRRSGRPDSSGMGH
ncbi:hypothetical protein [Streptomyces sp. NBC_01320]|uniref:hypothetical protein n=1 Tax=Streptomyces sp. NBC_01320 TaxID=2903824 RepID=UPI002E10780F|nr:hypothetical protein OG395_03790 [Streptomyces sp. NBC_01320]